MLKWYKIIGISTEMLKACRGKIREDLIVWEENNKVEAHLLLSWFEAWKMRRQIKKWNLDNPAKEMYLIKM